MTTISPKNFGDIKHLSGLNFKPVKLSDEEIQRMKDLWNAQFLKPAGKPDNHPDNIYGYVKKDGKIIATLYNSGASETSNATYARTKNLPSMGESETLVGPELAQKRAREIADKMGGTIEKASTAQTQAQWQARPPMEWTYDYKAMAEAEKARDARAKTNVDTQLIGQADDDKAVAEFLEYMSKTPEERWHEQWLKSKGLTEEEFNALPPEEKQALVDEMTEEIKQKALEKAKEQAA